MSVTSSQIVKELRSESVCVDDAGGSAGRYRDQLHHQSVPVRTNYEQSLLAFILVFNKPHGVVLCVFDVRVIDPVLQGRLPDLHLSSVG